MTAETSFACDGHWSNPVCFLCIGQEIAPLPVLHEAHQQPGSRCLEGAARTA